jgi:uncharacterized protein
MSTGDQVVAAQQLRALVGEVTQFVLDKQLDRLDPHAQAFVARSPFVVVASADADGRVDASPRGDLPGFVRVLDERTLLLPDRKGNRRVDTMNNLLANPGIGLLFMVPGIDQTLRVNGRARVTTNTELLEPCAVAGSVPRLGLLIAVEEVFMHCARAFKRGRVWEPSTWAQPGEIQSLGTVLHDQIAGADFTAAEMDARLEEANRDLW